MTSSEPLNAELFKLRDINRLDIETKVNDILTGKSKIDLFHYIQSISKENYVFYFLAIIVIVFIWQRLRVSLSAMVGIIVALIILYLYNERLSHTTVDKNRDLMMQIETLDAITGVKHLFLYLEPHLIQFWADKIFFRKYAQDTFDRTLKLCDLFLNLYYDIHNGSQQCSADIDVAEGLRRKIMNLWTSVEFSVGNEANIINQLENSSTQLHDILLRLLEEIKIVCRSAKNGLHDSAITPPRPFEADDMIQENHMLY